MNTSHNPAQAARLILSELAASTATTPQITSSTPTRTDDQGEDVARPDKIHRSASQHSDMQCNKCGQKHKDAKRAETCKCLRFCTIQWVSGKYRCARSSGNITCSNYHKLSVLTACKIRTSNLQRHMMKPVDQNGHGGWSCKSCGKTFKQKYSLRRHQQKACGPTKYEDRRIGLHLKKEFTRLVNEANFQVNCF